MFYKIKNGELISITDIDLYYVDHDDGWYFFNTDQEAQIYFGLINEYAEKEYNYART